MSEFAKTLSCGVGAAAVLAIAIVTRPASVGIEPHEEIGKPLFAGFDDPYTAASLEIVKFDEGLGQISSFEVAQQNGRWVIPSHQNYPADAEDQLRDAATSLVDLEVVGIAGEAAGDHSLYGVVEPDEEKTRLGEKGVGTLVVMQDTKGNDLARLVIGKEVPGQEEQRFVRVPSRSVVYTAKVDPTKLSTKFEDWIEKDLLDLSAFDIKQLLVKDYSVQTGTTLTGQTVITNYDQRLAMTATYNDKSEWQLDELLEFRGEKLVPTPLLPGEELNKEKLDGLKDALAELEIVDVERKPEGMRADLKADKGFLEDAEGVRSLIDRGFYPVPKEGGNEVELLCNDGEVLARTKDGVEYVLRFGGITAGIGEGDDSSELNRYVFVSARIHEESFPLPDYESLPEDKETGTSVEQPAPLGAAGDEDSVDAGQEPGSESGSDAEADDADGGDDQLATESSSDDESDAESDQPENAADTVQEIAAPGDETEEPAEVESATEEESESADKESETDRIIKENKRKKDEYDEKRKKAEDKVNELNYRFADWYYVISEETYKNIHLGRGDVIKEKETSVDEGVGLDSFRKLEDEGLNKDDE